LLNHGLTVFTAESAAASFVITSVVLIKSASHSNRLLHTITSCFAVLFIPALPACYYQCHNSYVFGYYIDDQDPSMKRQKELFEHHQENLEKFTEKLRYTTLYIATYTAYTHIL
jgi:hypothetical protein